MGGLRKLQNSAEKSPAHAMSPSSEIKLLLLYLVPSTDPMVFAIRLPQPQTCLINNFSCFPCRCSKWIKLMKPWSNPIEFDPIWDTSSHFKCPIFLGDKKVTSVTGLLFLGVRRSRDPRSGTSCSVPPTCWGCWHSLPSSHTWIDRIYGWHTVPPWAPLGREKPIHGALDPGVEAHVAN